MTCKALGKITAAKFGIHEEYPKMFGLMLKFSTTVGCVSTCIKFFAYLDDSGDDTLSVDDVFNMSKTVYSLLQDAKVNSVDMLVGKPVEVEFEKSTFKDFRILTEVL